MINKPVLKSSHSLSSSPDSFDEVSVSPAIRQRLDNLGIPLDSIVKNAIASHHPSQVSTALSHVESNYELTGLKQKSCPNKA